ncbi:ras-like protein family member 11A-like isoform X2 [Onychostoma macrolepis]|uniref:ras-like protein family member 11A-like isoform X2 n=1 Tax=Onychostoma macrolepis TaxID=369639 RepID=UPI00272BE633|nr:ras-like protein family member 11A-like isoform X2 [Onychostoma macrolepis]
MRLLIEQPRTMSSGSSNFLLVPIPEYPVLDCVPNKNVKIVVLGASNVGKTALIVRFLTKRFIGDYEANTGALYSRKIHLDGEQVSLQVQDTPCVSLQFSHSRMTQRAFTVKSRSTAPFTGQMVMFLSSPSLTSTATVPSSLSTNMCAESIPMATSLLSSWEIRATCCAPGRSRITRVKRWLMNWEDPTLRLRPGRTMRASRLLFCTYVRRLAEHWEEEMGRREKVDYTLPGQRAQTCKS